MIKKIAVIALLAIGPNLCMATMFSKISLEKQVEEATSGVEVKLEETRVFKNDTGLIMTEYSFNVLESYNFSPEDLKDQKLKISMPGGTFNGMSTMIDGAPQFVKGDRSFLLLKKINSNIYLSNFTLGKYSIQELDGKTYYVSDVFPMDQEIGKISKEKMIEMMRDKWKISRVIPAPTITHPSPGGVIRPVVKSIYDLDRSPAQESVDEGIPLFFWSAFAVFICFFVFIFLKLGKSEINHKGK